MKMYPDGLQKLIKEGSKKSNMNYPISILKVMLRFQIAHQLVKGGNKLTYEEIALLMMLRGSSSIIDEVEDMKEIFTKEQKADFNLRFIKKSKKLNHENNSIKN